MHPSPVLANVEPLPASCKIVPSAPSSDDFILQSYDGTLKSTNFEEQSVAEGTRCVNDCWHDHGFGRCGHALSVETDNAHMECPLDMWENWLEPTSPECSDMCLEARSQYQAPHNDASSSAYKRNISPPCSSGNICMPSLPDTSAFFIESSPVYSIAYQHDSHPLDYMNNHVDDYLDINMGIHDNASNSMGVSYSPSIAHGNAPIMSTGSAAASGDDSFDDEASFFAAIASPPPHELNLATPLANQAATQPHLGARFSPPFHQNFKAAHNMHETRVIKNSGTCEARDVVSLLVKSSTPAIDDGYKWCKYGQKAIKDNVHPRCYFRCAQRNCPIKKQTESSSNMEGFVLITYFGKHNHH